MGYYFYGHGGSGDHGSEDRIRGTCRLLPCRPEILSLRPGEDWRYGLGRLADLGRIWGAGIGPGDICLASHPDAGTRLRGFGAQTLLWCWTAVGKLTATQKKGLDRLVVMDRRSLKSLESCGLRVCLGPDPAFLVERQIRPLGGCFRRDTVGLCCSAAIRDYECCDSLLYESYRRGVAWLLQNTQMDIALIPYCSRRIRDDGLILRALHEEFGHGGRVYLRPDGSSPELRGDLSLCRCVIGSAGAIAAWSCGVPALCIGADPRAMGLAMDLFGQWRGAVHPVAWLREPADLCTAIRDFLHREEDMRQQLEAAVPLRRQQSLSWSWNTMSMLA